jgi:hypothetical protein
MDDEHDFDRDDEDEPYDPIADPDNYSPEGFQTIEQYNEFWEQYYESNLQTLNTPEARLSAEASEKAAHIFEEYAQGDALSFQAGVLWAQSHYPLSKSEEKGK